MAYKYITKINPFEEYLMYCIRVGSNFNDLGTKEKIKKTIEYILEQILGSDRYTHLLDFNIDVSNDIYKITGNNLISSLWLSGIFPKNILQTTLSNVYIDRDIIYEYNYELKTLTKNKVNN